MSFNIIFKDNEELQDLLNTSGDRKLKLCEDIKKGVVCQNLEEITVLNAGDIFEILQKGDIFLSFHACHTFSILFVTRIQTSFIISVKAPFKMLIKFNYL